MMTYARYDADESRLVVDVWDTSLHYQVRFDAAELAEHDDEVIRRAAAMWMTQPDPGTLTPDDLQMIREAPARLVALVKRG